MKYKTQRIKILFIQKLIEEQINIHKEIKNKTKLEVSFGRIIF